jgi:hypothetical protein
VGFIGVNKCMSQLALKLLLYVDHVLLNSVHLIDRGHEEQRFCKRVFDQICCIFWLIHKVLRCVILKIMGRMVCLAMLYCCEVI